MTLDDHIRQLVDRVLNGVRGQLEAEVRTLMHELTRAAAEERTRAVAQATEAAVADVRQKAHAQLAQIRDAAQKHSDELRRNADEQIQELKRALDATRARAQADVEDARRIAQTQVDDVQRVMDERVGSLQARLADADRRLGDAAREAGQARAHARQAEGEHAARLVNAVRTIDEASSVGEVLERLAQGAAREAERVAVLVTRGNRLAGWSLVGFGSAVANPRSVDIDPAEAAAPPFAQGAGPREAVSVPVMVGGTTVAVLYADALAGETGGADRWRPLVEVLARHASRALDALTIQHAIGLSLPQTMARPSQTGVTNPGHDRSLQ